MSRSLAVHSFKGGTGKSTITANVAAALAARGKQVGVMDMDLEGPEPAWIAEPSIPLITHRSSARCRNSCDYSILRHRFGHW